MKLLYLSCHSVLEYDEVTLFHELGYEVFSPGAYVEPDNPGNPGMRPNIPGLVYKQEVKDAFHKIAGQHVGEDTKDYLTKEFVDLFDVIIVMHMPRWIQRNWEVMKHKRVIWRTIGQSVASTEASLKRYKEEGMEIVRYSPMEANIPGFIGQDAFIRFYKDPDIYKEWTGENKRVVTFCQHMERRAPACNWELFKEATRPFNRKLYGPGSEELDWGSGEVSFEELKEAMRINRVYFYTGTHPASYTLNFIEAWMTGIPIIAIGPQHGNAHYFMDHDLYEIPHLITNYYNGFWSDNITELQYYISELLNSKELAQVISANGRASAIKHFNKDMIKNAWKSYLER